MFVFSHAPSLLFTSRTAYDHIVHVLGIGAYYKVLIAQVTFHIELVYRCAQILVDFFLLGIVAHAHGYVSVAAQTPYVVGHFESDDENALVKLAGSFTQRMRAMVSI